MAQASQTKEMKVVGISLDLTIDEADLIHDILYRRVTGNPLRGRRGIADAIVTALDGAGVQGKGGRDLSGYVDIEVID